MTRNTVIICDHCKAAVKKINGDQHIDANPYGVDLHKACLDAISANRLIRLLRLEDIKINGVDYVYSNWFPQGEK